MGSLSMAPPMRAPVGVYAKVLCTAVSVGLMPRGCMGASSASKARWLDAAGYAAAAVYFSALLMIAGVLAVDISVRRPVDHAAAIRARAAPLAHSSFWRSTVGY